MSYAYHKIRCIKGCLYYDDFVSTNMANWIIELLSYKIHRSADKIEKISHILECMHLVVKKLSEVHRRKKK